MSEKSQSDFVQTSESVGGYSKEAKLTEVNFCGLIQWTLANFGGVRMYIIQYKYIWNKFYTVVFERVAKAVREPL